MSSSAISLSLSSLLVSREKERVGGSYLLSPTTTCCFARANAPDNGWKFKVKENRPRPVQRQLPLHVEQPTAEEIEKRRVAFAELKKAVKGQHP
jgi:hypothetical protein